MDVVKSVKAATEGGDEFDEQELVEMFRAVYGREPDSQDYEEGIWSHICAGVL